MRLCFILFLPLSLAASTSSITASSTSHNATSTQHRSNPPLTRPFPRPSTIYHSIHPPSFTAGFTRSHNPTALIPIHTRVPDPLLHSPSPHALSQKPIIIVFEVLSGLLITALLLGLLRCCYKYKTGPKRDRIAEVVSRHHLQRELQELERNPLPFRRLSLREPAPPYFPPPPSYNTVPPIPPVTLPLRSEYSEVPTHSPPSLRLQPQQPLHTLSHTNQVSSESIPALPSG